MKRALIRESADQDSYVSCRATFYRVLAEQAE
jgi:hypothetical protein